MLGEEDGGQEQSHLGGGGLPHHPSHMHAESLSAATTPTAMLAGIEREGNGPKRI